jgi:hypothetical protein
MEKEFKKLSIKGKEFYNNSLKTNTEITERLEHLVNMNFSKIQKLILSNYLEYLNNIIFSYEDDLKNCKSYTNFHYDVYKFNDCYVFFGKYISWLTVSIVENSAIDNYYNKDGLKIKEV